MEETLTGHIRQTDRGAVVTVGPQTARQIAEAVRDALAPLQRQGRRPVVLCAPRVRAALKRLIGPTLPDVAVLGYNEIDSVQVQSVRTVGIES